MKLKSITCAILIATVLPGSIALSQAPTATAPFATVSSETFYSERGDTVLIDVREPAEWEQSGVPTGARRVSSTRSDFVEAILAELGGDKTRPVAVVCRSGARSLKAAERLVAAGFTNVTNVGDGMMGRDGVGKGWQAAGLPTTPYRD